MLARPGAPTLRTQGILDLDGAQRARLRREQLDHSVARAAAPPTGAREDRVNMLVPTVRRHRLKTSVKTIK